MLPASRRARAPRRRRPAPSRRRSRPAGGRETSVTRAPSRAAVSAANSPAAPAPTTTRSDRTRQHGITVCAMEESSRRAIWLRHDDVFAHDVPGHPERPARIRALEAEMSAHGWFGVLAGRRRRRSTRSVLQLVHPAAHVAFDRGAVRGGRRRDRRRHVRGARDLRGGAAGRGRRGARWSTRCWAGRRPSGVSALRPPGHHAEAARAMGFCFFGNVAVAARRATSAHGLVAGDDRRLGRPPRQRHQRHLPRATPTCCSSRSTSRRCIRAPGRRPTWGRARARASRSTCRCRAGRGDAVYRSLVEHVACALIRAWEPELVLISRRASTRTATTRWPPAG